MATLRQIIEERIRVQVPDYRVVEGVASLQAVRNNRLTVPGAFVFRTRRRAGANVFENQVHQRVVEGFAVVIVVKNVRDPRGGDADDLVEALSEATQGALLGWEPSPDHEPVEYEAGAMVTIADGHYYWQDTYRTARHIRAV